MRSVRHKLFNKAFESLTPALQESARVAFAKWQNDPKTVGWKLLNDTKANLYSAQIGYGARAIAMVTKDERGEALACWIWVGTHETYNHFIDIQRSRNEQSLMKGLSPAQRGSTLGQRAQATLPGRGGPPTPSSGSGEVAHKRRHDRHP